MSLNKNIIYADNHASTPMDPRVADEIDKCNREVFANPDSLDHEYGRLAATVLDDCRAKIAELINAPSRDNIVFTSGATEANNLVFFSLSTNARYGYIMSTPLEHKSVLKPLKDECYTVSQIPFNNDYSLDVSKFTKMIEEENGEIDLISCMYVNNEIGTIFPIKEIGTIAKRFKIPFHCDASQAPAWMEINVSECNIDYLTLSGHKIYGPKGVGILYVSDKGKIQPMIYGGNQEYGRRAGTQNLSGIVGFTKALELCKSEYEDDSAKIGLIRDEIEKIFRERIQDTEFSINGGKNRIPNNISITFPELEPGLLELVNEAVAVSDGSACQTGNSDISHVLKALGYGPGSQTLRIGLGRFSQPEDAKVIAEKIVKTVDKLRR
jgi:cysteine desulfurase